MYYFPMLIKTNGLLIMNYFEWISYHSVHDEVGEGRLIEQAGGEHHQGVEPTASLVQTLGDEVGRETLFKSLL
jgi:hypothetical protein